MRVASVDEFNSARERLLLRPRLDDMVRVYSSDHEAAKSSPRRWCIAQSGKVFSTLGRASVAIRICIVSMGIPPLVRVRPLHSIPTITPV